MQDYRRNFASSRNDYPERYRLQRTLQKIQRDEQLVSDIRQLSQHMFGSFLNLQPAPQNLMENIAANKPIYELIGLALDEICRQGFCPQVASGREIPIETVSVSYEPTLPNFCFLTIETFLTHDYDVIINKDGSDEATIYAQPKARIRFANGDGNLG